MSMTISVSNKKERKFKMSILNCKKIPLLAVYRDPAFILFSITPYYKYSDGTKTDEIAGTAYDVCDTYCFDKFRVKIPNQKVPLLDNDDLQTRRENGERFFVAFENLIDVPYERNDYKGNVKVTTWEDACTATSVKLVKVDGERTMNSTMENVIKGILERSVAGVFSYAKVRKVESRAEGQEVLITMKAEELRVSLFL